MEIYDYIVVGAGSSGCVVASRLSEDSAVRVLLVEAGPSMDGFRVRVPAGAGKLFMDKRFNWAFDTEPVPTLGGRTVYWPRGKGPAARMTITANRGRCMSATDRSSIRQPTISSRQPGSSAFHTARI